MPGSSSRPVPQAGLAELRRSGSATELLFLYECATLEPNQLRPIAEHLGLTVQAASHVFRQLRDRRLVAVEAGKYRPTVEGVAWLHECFGRLADDVRERIDRLHVIRSCRAVALADLSPGDPVSLELRDGLLSARPGSSGPSRGRAVSSAPAGRLVEVGNLSGIVPLSPATVTIRTLTDADLTDPALPRRLRGILPDAARLLGAEGLEAYCSLRQVTDRPILRFAAAAACREAAHIGVPSTIVVLQRDLPALLSTFSGSSLPTLDVGPLRSAEGRPRARSRGSVHRDRP